MEIKEENRTVEKEDEKKKEKKNPELAMAFFPPITH